MDDQARIKKLLDLIASVDEGKMLVDVAAARHVNIFFDPDLVKQYRWRFLTGNHIRGYYNTEKGAIGLCAPLSDSQLLRTLTHELSHLNQFQYIAPKLENNLSPRDHVVFERLLEGEADGRAARIIQAINRKSGKDILPKCRGGLRPFDWLAGKFKSAAELSERSFMKFQKSFDASLYDESVWEEANQNPPKTPSRLCDAFNASAAALFKNGDTFYLGAKDMPELIEKVRAYVPKQYRRANP